MLSGSTCSILLKKPIIAIIIFFVATQCFSQQYNIDSDIKTLQIQNHKLYSSYQQPKNMLEAFWGEWPASEKEAAEKWFELSEYNPDRLRRQINWYGSEYTADKENWDYLIASEGLDGEQKERYLAFLKDEKKLLTYYNIYWSNKLHAVKMYGGDWVEEFTEECIVDYNYVFMSTLHNLFQELKNCFSAAMSEAIKNLAFQTIDNFNYDSFDENLNASGDKFVGCIGKLPLRSLTFAIQAALKRQFIKEMNEKDIDDLVAAYWWDVKIMKKKNLNVFDKVFADIKKSDFWLMNVIEDKVKESAAREVLPQIRKEVAGYFREQYRKQILDKGLLGTKEADNFITNARKRIMKGAMDKTVEHIKNEMYICFEFFIENLQQYLTIREGYYKFSGIMELEVATYKHVRRCLAKNGVPVTPENMLEVMRKDKKEFLAWYKDNCKEKECTQEKQIADLLAKLAAHEKNIDALANEIMGRCSKINSITSSANQAVINTTGSDEENSTDALFENTKASIEEWIGRLESLKSKAMQGAVGAGIYKSNCQGKAVQTCDDVLTIAGSPEETQQLGAAMGALANMSDALDYSDYVSGYYEECNFYVFAAKKIRNELQATVNDYQKKLISSVNTNIQEPELVAVINMYDVANGLFHSNEEKLALLENELKKFTGDYELALTIIPVKEKIFELEMLSKRLKDRRDNSSLCHAESASRLHQTEVAISNINMPGSPGNRKPEPELSAYIDKSMIIVNEIEAQLSEIETYRLSSENAVAAAQSCMNDLLEVLPDAVNNETSNAMAENDRGDELVSGGGFVEISQSDTIVKDRGDEALDPEVKAAMEDYYMAQRLSNYGTKGFNQNTMQTIVNSMLAQQRAENEQAMQELGNMAKDMIKSSAEYYGDLVKSKKATRNTAEEKSTKRPFTDPYKKYYEGLDTDLWKLLDNNNEDGLTNPGYANGALNLMNESAARFDNDGTSQSSFGGSYFSGSNVSGEGTVDTDYLDAIMLIFQEKYGNTINPE